MGSHVDSVDPDSERSLSAAVERWRDTLSPARLDALSSELGDMVERELLKKLREAIERDPRTLNAIAVAAGLNASIVWRFMEGQRSLSLEAFLALADTLGLELTLSRKGKGRRPSGGTV
jgi:hypothetical protein